MAKITQNGKAYDSGDVIIFADGQPFDEVKEISYSTTQETQKNHSLGNDATSWSEGKIDHTASITIYMNSLRKMMKLRGNNILKWNPITINVTFVNDNNDIVNDTLIVKFTSMGREVTGDMGLAQKFDLLALDIEYDNF